MYTTEGWLSCVNLEEFDDRATSAKWTDKTKHPATFTSKSRIAFYADADCNGKQRNWLIDAPNGFPGNFFLDNIDNQISAFELWPHYRD
ncbi:hypothetical protein BBJ28_00011744 [Nothophytophthora sp. Chile5]|nr:hypothetical protein BBJ28_00011744 [Nothophytophthora sp. Chile5]